jgi:hypothetical protein
VNLLIAASNNGGVVLAPMSILLLGFVLKSMFSESETSTQSDWAAQERQWQREEEAENARHAKAVAWRQQQDLFDKLSGSSIYKTNPFGSTINMNSECHKEMRENMKKVYKIK